MATDDPFPPRSQAELLAEVRRRAARRRLRRQSELAAGVVAVAAAIATPLALAGTSRPSPLRVATTPSAAATTTAQPSPTVSSTSSTSIVGPVTTTIPAVTAPTSTAAPTTSLPESTGPPVNCQPGMLQSSVRYPSGAVGHGGETVVLVNRSSLPCRMYGYPGLGLLDNGKPVALTVERQTGPGFLYGFVPPTSVELAPGSAASFGIEWLNRYTVTATTIVVTPPNDTAQIDMSVPDYDIPNNHTVTVTAIAAGTGAGGYKGQGT